MSQKHEVKRRFTDEEKSYILHNINKLSPEEMAKELDRSPKSIKKHIKDYVENRVEANAVNTNSETEQSKASVEPTKQSQTYDPNSNAKAPEGIRAGELMAGGEKNGRPGVVMMTSAASQALDEAKKQFNSQQQKKPHEASIHRIRR